MPAVPWLLSLATAVPPHVLPQQEVARQIRTLFAARLKDYDRVAGVFAATGIVKRHAVRPLTWYLEPRGWPDRTAAYLEGAEALFLQAAETALARAGLTARQIDTVVTISSSGVATPSLEARLAARLGLRPDVARVPVFGLGCAAGVTGLSLAARLAVAAPGSRVLLVAVELCTLAFRLDRADKTNVVASALFGDGAAAAVVATGTTGLARIEGAAEHTWPDTLNIMGWSVDPLGLGVILNRSLPAFVAAELPPVLRTVLRRLGLRAEAVERFVCHPGGAKVLAALEKALALTPGALREERAVLADYGNMSSPTALFVLERVIAGGLPPRALVMAMGPGFTATCLSLRAAA